jgi:hypothetical protein
MPIYFSSFFYQASLLLSKISSESVGVPLEASRLYDAVNCLLSWMVCICLFNPPETRSRYLAIFVLLVQSMIFFYDYNIFAYVFP